MRSSFRTNRYHVYIYLNPLEPGTYNALKHTFRFRPFYVGKGTADRLEDHLREAQGLAPVTNKQKVETIRRLVNNGASPYIIKINDNLTHGEALALEKDLISEFGITQAGGLLTNISKGNEAVPWNSKLIQFFYLLLTDEHDRLVKIIHHLKERIETLPRGSVQTKTRYNQSFCYLAYRQGEKVKFDYIGKLESKRAKHLASLTKARAKLAKQQKELEDELNDVQKLLFLIAPGIHYHDKKSGT